MSNMLISDPLLNANSNERLMFNSKEIPICQNSSKKPHKKDLIIDFNDSKSIFSLRSDEELRVLNLVFKTLKNPLLSACGAKLTKAALAPRIPYMESILKKTIFQLFCGGTDLKEAEDTSKKLKSANIQTIFDYAVESSKTEAGFQQTMEQIILTIETAAKRPKERFCAIKITGLSSIELLAKIHSYEKLNQDEEEEYKKLKTRLLNICQLAYEKRVKIYIDAEESWIQNPINNLVEEMMKKYNKEEVIVFTTIQMYLKDRLSYLNKIIEDAKSNNYKIGVKLVRGAYLEKETKRSLRLGYENPIQPNKQATDQEFNKALSLCIKNIEHVALCAATHNIESIEHLLSEMQIYSIEPNHPHIYISQLLGMLDRLTIPLAKNGFNCSKYVPYGQVREVLPYLLRRADENKSVSKQSVEEMELIQKELQRRGAI